ICGLVLVATVIGLPPRISAESLIHSASRSVVPQRRTRPSAAAAVDAGRHGKRFAIPGGRDIRFAHLLERLEHAEVIVLAFRGPDVKLYKTPPTPAPVIMGHENIGVIAKAGREFTRRKGFKEGDLVFVEHYVMCGKCEWCHAGQYRHCENTDWRNNPEGIRYGYTSAERAPHLWGGFAQYVYLPWNAVVHYVPQGVTPELAGLVTPMANGVEWSLFDG